MAIQLPLPALPTQSNASEVDRVAERVDLLLKSGDLLLTLIFAT